MPVVRATPETIESVIRDLIDHPSKRRDIGLPAREFSLKWHSDKAGAKKFQSVYTELLTGRRILLN